MGKQQTTAGKQTSKCPHPEAVGKRWGDPISEERQEELQSYYDEWKNEDDPRKKQPPYGPFVGEDLTGADVFWIAENLSDLHLEGADLSEAHLEGAPLGNAHMEGAFLTAAYMEGVFLLDAHMEGVVAYGVRLEGAFLQNVRFDGADLTDGYLQRASLMGAHLEGADFSDVLLQGAALGEAWLDSKSVLDRVQIDNYTRLGDIHCGGVGVVNLTQINWNDVHTLGDEQGVGLRSHVGDRVAIIRAYRQLAAQLRTQGLSEVADRFMYRAQVRQRWEHLSVLLEEWKRPWRWPENLLRYLGSFFLAVLAGYGYRPGRTLFCYAVTILSFMSGYLLVTHGVPLFGLTEPQGTQPLQWYEALVLSVASFHGRGFFPQGINLGDPVAILAASEAVIGLFIEISFIATFTQRYFGGK